MVIYCVRNTVNSKCYVGKTKHSVKHRQRWHEKEACGLCRWAFHRAIRKYGIEAFEWSVLKEVEDPEDLDVWERHFISKLKTKLPNGYNMTDGGDGGSTGVCSVETREKLRKASTGRKHSEESKQKMSKAQRGKVSSPATRAKIRQTLKSKGVVPPSRLGMKSTDQQKQKQSKALKGRPKPANFGSNLSSKMKGVSRGPCTEARKEKLRAYFTGRPWPEARRTTEREKKKNAD